MSKRSAITGMGIWSCIGTSLQEVTKSLEDGKCGLEYNPLMQEIGGCRSCNIGIPPVPSDKRTEWLGAHQCTMSLNALEASCAVADALKQSGLKDLSRVALIVSNDSMAKEQKDIVDIMRDKRDTRYLGAYRVFKTLNSSISMNLAQVFGIGGLTLTVSAACAGGGHAIGIGHNMIKSGMADCVIVVGAQESGVYAFQAFDALGVLSANDNPQMASIPFGLGRSGLVPSGGAACVVLEREDMAIARRIPIHGYVEGYGYNTSPNIVTPSVESLVQCMWSALRDAGCLWQNIDLVAAHATGTQSGDAAEAQAIWEIFKETTPVTATKSLTGHECWMAGVSQVVYTLIQMNHGFISPHPFYTEDPELPLLDIYAKDRRREDMRHALCNAFGFGGTNSSLVIKSAMP